MKGHLIRAALGACAFASLWKRGGCLQQIQIQTRTFYNHKPRHATLFAHENSSPSDRDILSDDPSTFSKPSTLATITIPQKYPESKSPTHGRSYPSQLHSIHVASILTQEQASKCLEYARKHAEETKCWDAKDSERHVSYSTADFPLEDCPDMQQYLDGLDFESRIFSLLSELYSIDADDMEFLDLFCAHYTASSNIDEDGNDDGGVMDRLDPHRDGTLLSFTLVLNGPNDYEGGGTVFDALIMNDDDDNDEGRTQELDSSSNGMLQKGGVLRVKNAGEAVLHCGKIRHGAHVVSKGERTTITGFVDVHDRCLRGGVLAEACKNWGRMDEARRRFDRQIASSSTTSNGSNPDKKGWILGNSKYLGNSNGSGSLVGRSHIEGFVPAFDSIVKRGGEEYQRTKNLITEDLLLRDILLPEEDRGADDPLALFDLSQFGDITVL